LILFLDVRRKGEEEEEEEAVDSAFT